MPMATTFPRRALAPVAFLLALTGCGPREPQPTGVAPVVQRLTEAQYRQIIADVFGPDIEVA